MKEIQRIAKLLEDLHDGSPWIDVNLSGTLKEIPAQHAARKIFPERNSIWEIINHVISWRIDVLQRVQGKITNAPDNNYFNSITDPSETAWSDTLKKLEETQREWVLLLHKFKEKDLEKVYSDNNMTYYEHIHGIIQHDAYHLGQIVMLAKMLQ